MKHSAGTLLYRHGVQGLEVLLVHPSGWYNKKSPWGIPKGEPDEGEEDLECTARRETLEETGVAAEALISLGHSDYSKSKKRVHCWAGLAPTHAAPHAASWEVDQVEFLNLASARALIHPDQAIFLERLQEHVQENA